MENKEQIRSVYRELMGYLSQTPQPKDPHEGTGNKSVWDRVNAAIDELEKITGRDYGRFKLVSEHGTDYIRIINIRMSLGGIIGKIHAEYFSDEDEPFSGKPSVIMNQNQKQEQHQETYIQMVVELASVVGQKLQDPALKPEERSFLEKIKSGISKAKSGLELINLILSTGSALGLTAAAIETLLR